MNNPSRTARKSAEEQYAPAAERPTGESDHRPSQAEGDRQDDEDE